MVVSPMLATIPRSIAAARISGTPSRDTGSPCSCGSSQARAFIDTTVPGGKDRRPSPPGSLLESR